jgi:hypothetical protein
MEALVAVGAKVGVLDSAGDVEVAAAAVGEPETPVAVGAEVGVPDALGAVGVASSATVVGEPEATVTVGAEVGVPATTDGVEVASLAAAVGEIKVFTAGGAKGDVPPGAGVAGEVSIGPSGGSCVPGNSTIPSPSCGSGSDSDNLPFTIKSISSTNIGCSFSSNSNCITLVFGPILFPETISLLSLTAA